ncbi:TetR/AcrR family transcriptional regulator [Acinetobacter qingfengensis]|uniref:HTH tetR-type domain-containing protein n=1 Tax=Acinetobacter qingfengensis TaxID=1262585 RepID=A0A1E7RFD3_9GAMM|nr:TetR/AcrR family transcriptional regulator [Acinetobacter qingfengensis]KAA8735689.1 TetR/AcrR family transcriptional regulator [Acinetobacter qingfengensis]OEY97865.1 hypothetical protein BJI46_07285 [Acinetobacter qingfengensis]
MKNTFRSEQSRNLIIQSALTIIARDGASKLTFDAIAKESGISKGRLTHHFKNKEEIIKALLEHQVTYFSDHHQQHLKELGDHHKEANLVAQISTLYEIYSKPDPIAFAILGALMENPMLLAPSLEKDSKIIQEIRAEAEDPELAILRWMAARGLAIFSLLGGRIISDEESEKLFDRLKDNTQWERLKHTDN